MDNNENKDKGRVVVVEDDDSIRRLVELALRSHGYDAQGFENAADALGDMKREAPDVVIMDIMLGGMDGVEAVSQMRRDASLRAVPVIMLTAKDTEIDKILGLDAGADDYVTKPFSVLELCARVRAQLRRRANAGEGKHAVYEAGELRLDDEARLVTLSGDVVDLTFKEYELLRALMERRGKAVSRQELLERVWGYEFFGETRTLDMHIGSLRQKLRDDAGSGRFIKTVRGVGYRFVGGLGQ